MKRHLKKIVILVMTLALGLGTLSSCVEVNGERVALVIDGNQYSRSEAMLYFYYMQYEMEYNVYGIADMLYDGLMNYWAFNDGEMSNIGTCREYAMQHMIQTKILCMQAEKDGVILDEDDELILTRTTNKFMREYAQVANAAEASKAEVSQFIRDNMIANKEYLHITNGIDTSYDEEDMIRKDVEGITVSTKLVDGEYLPVEEQHDILEYYLDEVWRLLDMGMRIDAISELYSEDTHVGVNTVAETDVKKPEGYDETQEPRDYYDLGWSLKTGESRTLLQLNQIGNYAGYAARCINDDDEQLKAEAIAAEMAQRRIDLFNEVYEAMAKSYKNIHVYTEVVDDFQISETLYDGADYQEMYGTEDEDTIIY